jgi:hypothetical protein
LGKWLIKVLGDNAGRAGKQQTLSLIQKRYGHLLTEDDWLPQPSNGEIKWHTRQHEKATPW